MANAVDQNPIIVDTQGATALVTQTIRVRKIRWVGATTADHVAQIKNRHGKIMWRTLLTDIGTVGEIVAPIESDFDCFPMDGLLVDDLDSGILYIYVEDNPPFKTT